MTFRPVSGALVVMCTLVLQVSVFAQTTDRPRVGVYVKGGVDFEHLDVSSSGVRSTDSSKGFAGGLALMMPANRKLAFQVELLLIDGKPISTPAAEPVGSVALIGVPLLLRANVANGGSTRVGIIGGAMPISQFKRNSGSTVEEYSDTLLTIGVDIERDSGLLVDFRYNRGVIEVSSVPGVRLASRSRGFIAMIGWRLY